MVFIELPLFTKYVDLPDEELRDVQTQLLKNPEAGDLIKQGRGLRKIRIGLSGRVFLTKNCATYKRNC
ncbi:hypothetical protein FACS1894158_12840 [Betaproteobacteria bacterium]|nr:hypothetical protein FACS1894158_12840 [Betaproteobacteria bacterium]